MTRQGEGFRAKAYREASEAITVNTDITDPEQLKGVKYIGKTMDKLLKYVQEHCEFWSERILLIF